MPCFPSIVRYFRVLTSLLLCWSLFASLSAAPQSCTTTELLINGGFETGDLSGWGVIEGCPNPPNPERPETTNSTTLTPGFGFTPTNPAMGAHQFKTTFSGAMDCGIILAQLLSIPDDAAAVRLSYQEILEWFSFGNEYSGRYAVQLFDTTDLVVLETLREVEIAAGTSSIDPDGWSTFTHDLTGYAGQTVALVFVAVSEGSGQGLGWLQLDDVSVEVTTISDDYSLTFQDTIGISCPEGNDGCITALVNGGTAPYTYVWSNGDTTATACGLSAATYTLSITDADGCPLMASFVMSPGVDTIPPLANAADLTIYLDANGNANISSALIDDNSEDNCGIASITIDESDFGCGDLGENMVVFTVEDLSGNMTSDTALVAVLDTIAPLFNQTDLVVYLDENGSATVSSDLLEGSVVDNCSVTIIDIDEHEFGCDDTGENMLGVSVEDASGNATTTTVSVMVLDTIAPETNVADIEVYLDATGNVSITAASIADDVTDNCGIVEVMIDQTDFGCGDLGGKSVGFRAEDPSGNTTVDSVWITVLDTIAPVITCPENVMIDCDNVITYDPPIATDNCTVLTIEQLSGPASGDTLTMGEHVLSYRVVDESGNADTCLIAISANDPMAVTVVSVETDTLDSDIHFPNGAIDIEVSGGVEPYTFSWEYQEILVATTEDLDSVPLGDYLYTITDALGCTRSDTVNVPGFIIISVVENLPNTTLSYYPNPARDWLSIDLRSSGTYDWRLRLFDINGRLLREQFVKRQATVNTDFDVSTLPAGLYLLHVQKGNQVMYRKLVVD